MKIDLDLPLKDLKGKDFADKATYKMVFESLLTAPTKNPEDKIPQFKLALKITQADGEVDLTSDEIVLLKKIVKDSEITSPLVTGRVFELFNEL